MLLHVFKDNDFPKKWSIWHARWMHSINDAIFIDTDNLIWGHGLWPILMCTHSAEKILVNSNKHFIIIDGIDDDEKSQDLKPELLEVTT